MDVATVGIGLASGTGSGLGGDIPEPVAPALLVVPVGIALVLAGVGAGTVVVIVAATGLDVVEGVESFMAGTARGVVVLAAVLVEETRVLLGRLALDGTDLAVVVGVDDLMVVLFVVWTREGLLVVTGTTGFDAVTTGLDVAAVCSLGVPVVLVLALVVGDFFSALDGGGPLALLLLLLGLAVALASDGFRFFFFEAVAVDAARDSPNNTPTSTCKFRNAAR